MSLDHFFKNVRRVDMGEAEYRVLDRLNASTLKKLLSDGPVECGRVIREWWGDPSPAMIVGSAVHCRVLEPDDFAGRYAVAPKVDRRTTEGKAEFAAFENEAWGKMMLTADQGAQVEAMAASVASHPEACKVLAGDHEVTLLWEYNMDGRLIPMKARLDCISGWGCDLKTTKDASPEGFAREVAKYYYHVQVALYRDAAAVLLGADVAFPIVAVENSRAPYPVGVYTLSDDAIERGRMRYMDAIEQWDHFDRNGWPMHHTLKCEEINLPAWA